MAPPEADLTKSYILGRSLSKNGASRKLHRRPLQEYIQFSETPVSISSLFPWVAIRDSLIQPLSLHRYTISQSRLSCRFDA
jgi:hypothetical protein